VLGASNLWFSVTVSALHLPLGRGVGEQVTAHWELLGEQPSAQVVAALVDGMPALRELRSIPTEQVWSAISELRAIGGPPAEGAGRDLLEAEWDLLSHPTTDRQDADFRAVPTAVPHGHEDLLQQVVLVSRLREVQALIGFTRLSAPERRESSPEHRVGLVRGSANWVPAVERRGEGIFIELHEGAVASWVDRVAGHPRIGALRQAHRRWARNRDKPFDGGFPTARYLLLHTLSHLLVRQVALECGYSSASLAERLYVGTRAAPAAGVLISTAASDSEGTLGGLVALGREEHLGRLLDDALREAERCSSDPLCAEHVPEDPSDALHAAACHACLFASETTCETNNRWLDRAVLVQVPGCEDLAFIR